MTFDEIKQAVLALNDGEKTRFLLEIVPFIWSAQTVDKACLDKMKELLDEAIEKDYHEQHMGNI